MASQKAKDDPATSIGSVTSDSSGALAQINPAVQVGPACTVQEKAVLV